MKRGETVGILELESNTKRTALGLMSAAVGKALHIGEQDEDELKTYFDSTLANWNVFLSMALVALTRMLFTTGSNTLPVDWNVVLYS